MTLFYLHNSQHRHATSKMFVGFDQKLTNLALDISSRNPSVSRPFWSYREGHQLAIFHLDKFRIMSKIKAYALSSSLEKLPSFGSVPVMQCIFHPSHPPAYPLHFVPHPTRFLKKSAMMMLGTKMRVTDIGKHLIDVSTRPRKTQSSHLHLKHSGFRRLSAGPGIIKPGLRFTVR